MLGPAANLWQPIYKLLTKNLQNYFLDDEQIFRRNKLNLDCERHFEVFNNYEKAVLKSNKAKKLIKSNHSLSIYTENLQKLIF